jgi:hypothetical protein
MKPRWSVSDAVLAAFHECVARERLRLMAFFNQLAEFPSQLEHYHERGPDGRLYSVAHFPPWIVTYWVDPAGSVVRIVELELVS